MVKPDSPQKKLLKDWEWQSILWREWRNTDDSAYADRLFEIVADRPVGFIFLAVPAVFAMYFSILAGLSLGVLTLGFAEEVLRAFKVDPGSDYLTWTAGFAAIITGLIMLSLMARGGVTWRKWLRWAVPSELYDSGLEINAIIQGLAVMLVCGVISWIAGGQPGSYGMIIVIGALIIAAGINKQLLSLFVVVFLGTLACLYLGYYFAVVCVFFGVFLGLMVRLRLYEETPAGDSLAWEHRDLLKWWGLRPHIFQVKKALQRACEEGRKISEQWVNLLDRLTGKKSGMKEPEEYISLLQRGGWVERFVPRYCLVKMGGEVTGLIEPLLKHEDRRIRKTALYILEDIGQDTTERLQDIQEKILCPDCLVHFAPHEIALASQGGVVTYISHIGCRKCRQSYEILDWQGGVSAVLDRDMDETVKRMGNDLQVDWIAYNRRKNPGVFDFDRVEIKNADDDRVEAAMIDVMNDIDDFRYPRYAKMECIVSPECKLSENTRRVIGSMFRLKEGSGT